MTEENDSEFDALHGIAEANLSMGKIEEAISNYLELGGICEERGNLSKAYDMYKKVLDLNPLNMSALNKVGVIYNSLNPDESDQKGKKKKKEKKKNNKK